MTADLYRIEISYDGLAPLAPKTVIAKLSSPDEGKRRTVARIGFYEREALFYKLLAGESGIGTPIAYFVHYDPESARLCLLLEDLSHLRAVDDSEDCNLADALKAVSAAAEMHAKWWDHQSLQEHTWLLDRPIAPPPEVAQVRYVESLDPFLEIVGDFFPQELEDIARALGPNIPRLCDLLARHPITLCHGDFKSGNLMFDDRVGAANPVVAFDWQMPSRTRGARDVAHFLMYTMTPTTRQQWETQIVKNYLRTLKAHGVQDYSERELVGDIKIALLTRFAGRVISLVRGGKELLATPGGSGRLMASVERLSMVSDWNCEQVLE